MTGNLRKLIELHDVHPILVKMPNEQTSIANKQGIVKLNSNITLYDVLLVPGLTCNLISVAQLINDLMCIVTFTPQLCVIQDLSLRMPIGVDEQRRGVYLFKDAPLKQVKKNQGVTCNVWHQRLGHPST